jgi:hypothetical protein
MSTNFILCHLVGVAWIIAASHYDEYFTVKAMFGLLGIFWCIVAIFV